MGLYSPLLLEVDGKFWVGLTSRGSCGWSQGASPLSFLGPKGCLVPLTSHETERTPGTSPAPCCLRRSSAHLAVSCSQSLDPGNHLSVRLGLNMHLKHLPVTLTHWHLSRGRRAVQTLALFLAWPARRARQSGTCL